MYNVNYCSLTSRQLIHSIVITLPVYPIIPPDTIMHIFKKFLYIRNQILNINTLQQRNHFSKSSCRPLPDILSSPAISYLLWTYLFLLIKSMIDYSDAKACIFRFLHYQFSCGNHIFTLQDNSSRDYLLADFIWTLS